MSCTCASPTLLLQLLKAFHQSSLAGCHLLLDGFLLAGQAASAQNHIMLLLHWNKMQVVIQYVVLGHMLIHVGTHSLVRGAHCLWVGGGDHEADSRGSEFTSSCILRVPFGAIVPEQSVPFPAQNLPLYTSNNYNLSFATRPQI